MIEESEDNKPRQPAIYLMIPDKEPLISRQGPKDPKAPSQEPIMVSSTPFVGSKIHDVNTKTPVQDLDKPSKGPEIHNTGPQTLVKGPEAHSESPKALELKPKFDQNFAKGEIGCDDNQCTTPLLN